MNPLFLKVLVGVGIYIYIGLAKKFLGSFWEPGMLFGTACVFSIVVVLIVT